jgi:hypothetical protein
VRAKETLSQRRQWKNSPPAGVMVAQVEGLPAGEIWFAE